MPLVRRDPSLSTEGATAFEPRRDLVEPTLGDAAARLAAAQAMAGRPDAADGLGLALESEKDPRVREALLAALLAISDPSAAAALAQHLRSEDAWLRNACIETLQEMPPAAASVLPGLLADPDPDVRLLATEIVRTQPTEAANHFLTGLLDAETNPNVCGAAVEVLAEVGTADAAPALLAARARFASTAFLPLAIDTVLARLGPGR
ncbi:HEAT repeat domain-containing protein [uncultured Methylobacterium sp.]|uniref:HEAT repeat domain-containing protein n=1 Tax=uncultured Methylobacterium sp. TaxID=157278 RepID=UPI0035CA22FE